MFVFLLVCLFVCLLVVSYLALHFLIQYILICERPSLGVLLVSLLIFGLRVLSRQNVTFCNCIMTKEHSVFTPGSLLITTSSHDTLKIISFLSFFETKKYLFLKPFQASKNFDLRIYIYISMVLKESAAFHHSEYCTRPFLRTCYPYRCRSRQ